MVRHRASIARTAFIVLTTVGLLAACTTAPPPPPTPDPGTLVVNVTGLPTGVDADVTVTVTGTGFVQALSASATLDDLDAGLYVVSAASVTDGSDEYGPVVTGSPADIPAGGSVTVTVQYVFLDPAETGTLEVNVVGLPVGVDADVSVTGPSGFNAAATNSTTFGGLTPGYYDVAANDVSDGGTDYQASVDVSPALVLPNETTTVTVTYDQVAAQDGDSSVNAAVHGLFRNTSGAPVWVDEPLFNEASPLDVKGLQYRNAVSEPGDEGDWIAFGMVHGEAPTTTITIDLACDPVPAGPSPIRAALRDDGGSQLGQVVLCGDSKDIAVPAVGGTPQYLLAIEPIFSDPYYIDYIVSIDAFCFQGCTYVEYVP